jgi:hypothetical protein
LWAGPVFVPSAFAGTLCVSQEHHRHFRTGRFAKNGRNDEQDDGPASKRSKGGPSQKVS